MKAKTETDITWNWVKDPHKPRKNDYQRAYFFFYKRIIDAKRHHYKV